MRSIPFILVFALLGLVALPASAQDCWQIAPGRSKVEFRVKHLVFLDVEGRIKKIEGCIDTLDTNFGDARTEVKLAAASIYTGNRDRDEHLRGKDFLDADEHPYIYFKGRSFVSLGANRYRISGDLTIRGVTNSLSMDGEYKGTKQMADGKTRAELDLSGSLNRFDYGLKWNGLDAEGRMLVGDTVDFDVHLVLIKNESTLAHFHRGDDGWGQKKLDM